MTTQQNDRNQKLKDVFLKSVFFISIIAVAGFYFTKSNSEDTIAVTAEPATANTENDLNDSAAIKSTKVASSTVNKAYQLIKWDDLLPPEDLKAIIKGPTTSLIDEGSEFDTIASPLKNKIEKPRDAFEKAMMSAKVVEKFNNKKVRLPGFIVPVDMEGEGITTEFFFVPFFGACLHLPPPPPNQIIYAKFPKGYKVKDLYEPYFMEAKLYTKQTENDMATSAYYADVANIYPYDGKHKDII